MRRSIAQWLWLFIALLLGWSALACTAVCLTLSTTSIGYDGRNLPSFGYDLAQQPKPDYDGGSALPFSKKESQPRLGRAFSAGFAELVAAETTVARNPNVYEALFEAPISGTTRAAQRASANDFLATQLQNDAQLNDMFNQQLGGNVLQHMESGSGSSYLNPPGTVWHHPFDNPNIMQLLQTGEHTAPSLQPVLHPGGVGGFGNFYGP